MHLKQHFLLNSKSITKALDKGKVVMGCFLGLKKAFNIVNDRILISKLRKYGIRGHILQWFESYLNNLFHKVAF